MELSNARITANHKTGLNIWGANQFQVSFPKEIKFEGNYSDMPNVISSTVIVDVNGSYVTGHIVGNVIKIGTTGKKGMCINGDTLVGESYSGSELIIRIYNRKGQLIHKQPLNKVAKVKDMGRFKAN